MNKKQLIVAWTITAILCLIILFAPKKHMRHVGSSIYALDASDGRTMPAIIWDYVLQRSLIAILLGGSLIYTLRDRKK